MLKAVLFVDAGWLCSSTLDLGPGQGKPDFQIDYRRLSGVLADEIGRRHHLGPIDVVRSHYFATRRHDHEAHDPALLQPRRALLARLQENRTLSWKWSMSTTAAARPVARANLRPKAPPCPSP